MDMEGEGETKVKARKLQWDRAQIIAVMLFAALLINAVVHFTHPAYRYYRERMDKLTDELAKRNSEFERNVVTNIVPSIMFVATNNVAVVESALAAYGTNLVMAAGGNAPSAVEQSEKAEKKRIKGHIFTAGSIKGFYVDSVPYFVGDDFEGGIVLKVGKSTVWTTDGVYVIERVMKSSEQNSAGIPREIVKND